MIDYLISGGVAGCLIAAADHYRAHRLAHRVNASIVAPVAMHPGRVSRGARPGRIVRQRGRWAAQRRNGHGGNRAA